MSLKPEWISQAECARRMDVTRAAVGVMIQSGRLSKDDRGRVNWTTAREEWEAKTQHEKRHNGRLREAPLAATATLATYKASHEEWRAKTAELEYRKAVGELVEREVVKRRWSDLARRTRQRIESLPDRLAGELAAIDDPIEVHRILREEIRVACAEIAAGD